MGGGTGHRSISFDTFIGVIISNILKFIELLQNTTISFAGLSISLFNAILGYVVLMVILSIFFDFGGDE